MLGILKKSEIPESQPTDSVGQKPPVENKKKLSAGSVPAVADELKQKLHQQSTSFQNPSSAENFGFEQIQNLEQIENPEIKRLFKRFDIAHNKSNKLLLDKEKKRLMVVSDGPTAFRELLNNSWSNFFFGWIKRIFGKPSRNCVGNWEREGLKFSTSKSDPKAKILEPMSHIRKALRDDHYKAVTMFYLDQDTNKFSAYPDAISIITQYQPLLDGVLETAPNDQKAVAEKIKEKNLFKDWYCTDQYLVNPESKLELNEITHNTCEAFYQAQGFDGLTVHYKVHDEDHAVSSDLSYDSIPWKHLYQRNDDSWKTSDDKHPMSKITLVRGKSSRNTSIPSELAYMHAWAQMALGRSFEDNETNLKLINEVEKINSNRIGEFNQARTPNPELAQKS
jgi:hypothetical protein